MPVLARTFFTVAVIAILAVGGLSLRRIITPRTVSRAVAPDGTEMCIVQRFNWSVELFTTSFVYRKPGGQWGEFYFDHEDDFWAGSRVTLDPAAQVAVFFRGGKPAITFDWASETYTMHRLNWTFTGAQSTRPADWNPPKSLQ